MTANVELSIARNGSFALKNTQQIGKKKQYRASISNRIVKSEIKEHIEHN